MTDSEFWDIFNRYFSGWKWTDGETGVLLNRLREVPVEVFGKAVDELIASRESHFKPTVGGILSIVRGANAGQRRLEMLEDEFVETRDTRVAHEAFSRWGRAFFAAQTNAAKARAYCDYMDAMKAICPLTDADRAWIEERCQAYMADPDGPAWPESMPMRKALKI